MAKFLLTDEEYKHIVSLKNEMLEKTKTASPRAGSVYRSIATQLSVALARETGNRASSAEKEASRVVLQEIKLQKQKDRLEKMQAKMAPAPAEQPAPPSGRAKPGA